MALGVILVCLLSIRRAKRYAVTSEDILIVAASAIGIALIAAKVLYLFVSYSPETIWQRLSSGDFTIFSEGGLVFYGGLLGGILGGWLGSLLVKRPLLTLEPIIVPFLPLGHAIGRIGCLLAGCCYGMPYEGFGAIHYPYPVGTVLPGQGYFPTQPIEAIGDVVICLFLLYRERSPRRSGSQLLAYLTTYALLRFFLEFFRGDGIRGGFAGLSTSQWISLTLLAVAAIRTVYQKRRSSDKQQSP